MRPGISPIFDKRLLSNLRSRRVLIATVLAALFAAVVSWVAIRDYRDQKELYDAERLAYRLELDGQSLRTYSQVRIVVGWEPRTLGVVAEGVGDRLGSTASLRGRYGPPRVERRAGENFLRTTEAFDFAELVGMLLSLTALLVTFDVIIGERASGTLDLVRSNAVTWRRILAGEYCAAVVTLLPATALVFAMLGFLVATAEAVEPSTGDWIGLIAQWGLLLLLVGAFSAIGILSSVVGRSEGGALIVAFGLWVALVAVYPDATAWLGRLSAISDPGSDPEIRFSRSALLAQLEPQRELERSAPADDRDPLRPREAAWRFRDRLWVAAPFTSYELGTSVVAGTDFEAYMRFLDRVEDLDHQLETWQREKVAEHPEREHRWTWAAGRLDLEGLPASGPDPEPVTSRLRRAGPSAAALLAWNFLPLLVALRITKTPKETAPR